MTSPVQPPAHSCSSQLFFQEQLTAHFHPSHSHSHSPSLTGRSTVLARTGIESVCLCRVGRPDCESQESHRLPASLPHRRPAHTGQGWARGWLLARGWARGWPGGGYWPGGGHWPGVAIGQWVGRGPGDGQGVASTVLNRHVF